MISLFCVGEQEPIFKRPGNILWAVFPLRLTIHLRANKRKLWKRQATAGKLHCFESLGCRNDATFIR